jgi:hypothetical protein
VSAARIVQRREWFSACPPVFDLDKKMRRAERLGRKIETLRTTWQEWRKAKP